MFRESPCAMIRTEDAAGSFASSRKRSLVRKRLTQRVKLEYKLPFRDTLHCEHILRMGVFHCRVLAFSIIQFREENLLLFGITAIITFYFFVGSSVSFLFLPQDSC